MKIFLFLSFTLSVFNSFSADWDKSYYQLVNQAEIAICEGKTGVALELYQKAFLHTQQPFGKDIKNALSCAIETDSEKLIPIYWTMLCNRGWDIHLQKDYLQLFSKEKQDIVIKLTAHCIYKNSVDTKLQKFVNNLLQKDIDSRRNAIQLYEGNYNKNGGELFNQTDSENISSFIHTIQIDGFLSEAKIGFGNAGNPDVEPLFYIPLLHDRMHHRKTVDSILYENVKTGFFHPQLLAELFNYSYGTFKDSVFNNSDHPLQLPVTGVILIVHENKLITCYYKPEQERKINESRRQIGLDSLDEFRTKAIFQYGQNKYHFIYPPLFNNIEFEGVTHEELVRRFQKNKPQNKN